MDALRWHTVDDQSFPLASMHLFLLALPELASLMEKSTG